MTPEILAQYVRPVLSRRASALNRAQVQRSHPHTSPTRCILLPPLRPDVASAACPKGRDDHGAGLDWQLAWQRNVWISIASIELNT